MADPGALGAWVPPTPVKTSQKKSWLLHRATSLVSLGPSLGRISGSAIVRTKVAVTVVKNNLDYALDLNISFPFPLTFCDSTQRQI